MMAAHLRWRGAAGMRELCGNVSTLAIWTITITDLTTSGEQPTKGGGAALFQTHVGTASLRNAGDARDLFHRALRTSADILNRRSLLSREGKGDRSGQMEWLKDSLRASDAPVKLIVSGSQILPTAAWP